MELILAFLILLGFILLFFLDIGRFCILLVVALMIIGYGNNIVHFVNCDFESPYKAEAIYGVGIAFPIMGAITGYIDIEDK